MVNRKGDDVQQLRVVTGGKDVPNVGSWQDFARSFTAHPDAEIFPLLDGKDFEDLAKSIEKNGMMFPIVVDRELRVIDGRNRLRAAVFTGTRPEFVYADMLDFEGDTKQLIAALNLHRRHLSPDQRAAAFVKLLGIHRKELAQQRRVESGKATGGLRGNPKQGGGENAATLPDKRSQRADTRRDVAREAGVSEHKVRQALAAADAGLVDEVAEGKMPLREAAKQAKATQQPKEPKAKAQPKEPQKKPDSKVFVSSKLMKCRQVIETAFAAMRNKWEREQFREELAAFLRRL